MANFVKLDQAMSLQFVQGDDQRLMDSISKVSCDENGYRDRTKVTKSETPSDSEQKMDSKCNTTMGGTMDATYSSWTVKHPSALSMFDRMMEDAYEKKIIVFLDYDGTLSPIVDDPDQAYMSDMMRSAVHEVARYFPTAIISGRDRDKVHDFVKLTDVYYAGSHGMDIMTPLQSKGNGDAKFQTTAINEKGNDVVLFQPAREFLPMIEEIFKLLEVKTNKIQGVKIENNKFCLSVHFRQVDKKDWSPLEEQVNTILKGYPQFCLTRGRKVLEIRPAIKWNKGNALEYLLETLEVGSSNDFLPLYIGDDRTDEDAFKVLKKRGHGYPIVVSTVPKDTIASYSLRDPSEVMAFLLRLAKWKMEEKLFKK